MRIASTTGLIGRLQSRKQGAASERLQSRPYGSQSGKTASLVDERDLAIRRWPFLAVLRIFLLGETALRGVAGSRLGWAGLLLLRRQGLDHGVFGQLRRHIQRHHLPAAQALAHL